MSRLDRVKLNVAYYGFWFLFGTWLSDRFFS